MHFDQNPKIRRWLPQKVYWVQTEHSVNKTIFWKDGGIQSSETHCDITDLLMNYANTHDMQILKCLQAFINNPQVRKKVVSALLVHSLTASSQVVS